MVQTAFIGDRQIEYQGNRWIWGDTRQPVPRYKIPKPELPIVKVGLLIPEVGKYMMREVEVEVLTLHLNTGMMRVRVVGAAKAIVRDVLIAAFLDQYRIERRSK